MGDLEARGDLETHGRPWSPEISNLPLDKWKSNLEALLNERATSKLNYLMKERPWSSINHWRSDLEAPKYKPVSFYSNLLFKLFIPSDPPPTCWYKCVHGSRLYINTPLYDERHPHDQPYTRSRFQLGNSINFVAEKLSSQMLLRRINCCSQMNFS